ncbi:hypothetical protein NLI96_g8518 [Meripilus lineatus]|uniref:Uncharacterized protein n=1 Tax=Meripilus lineatus TaxID=2056292 RepID=A0AAD5V1U4_9APHY|nr:hypothetical protein NLI96_g8518 [Physisporinus lineatus]
MQLPRRQADSTHAQVNKLFYYLSQTPAVWKRLLKGINYPLPPVPPTSRYSLGGLSSCEAERLVIRTLSLNHAWEAEVPDCYHEWRFHAQHRVKSMVLLPGSQYLVASVSDYREKNHSIVIWMLDHTYAYSVPLAKNPVSSKAYNLQARYMTVGGRRGITISFVCRGFKHASDARKGFNLSQISGDYDVDPPCPLVYECTVLHAALDSLESVGDPRLIPGSQAFIDHARSQPPPFRRIAIIKSTRCLGPATMDEILGSPYLAIVRYPNTIMFKNLDGGAISTLTPTTIPLRPDLSQCDYSIMTMRLLPVQNQILVVRKIHDSSPGRVHSPKDVYTIEFFDVPLNLSGKPLDATPACVGRVLHTDEILHEVYITDHYIPASTDESLNKQVFGSDTRPPRPISIIARGIDKYDTAGVLRFTIYPEKVETLSPSTSPTATSAASSLDSEFPWLFPYKQETQYKYTFKSNNETRFILAPVDCVYHILPGSYRSIFYSISDDDHSDTPTMLTIAGYWDDECLKPPSAEQLADGKWFDKSRHKLRKFAFDGNKDVGVSVMAWDETIGRLCMMGAGSHIVYVLDFAKTPREGEVFPLVSFAAVLNGH